ncbi:transcriptional regulator [Asanoa ishikariensis]|nr:helix-turn-helix domain-containing protein [Asanoa ishikariensis]GIF62924.1 transcriptional regulator [Asanoa ishikariensis]
MTEREVNADATTLRGLAHPLRVRMLGLLRENGPATATTLAERLGQSTGATSYHLRILANYGFVVDDPERNVGRERWWKAAHRTTRLEIDSALPPAEAEGYLRAVAAQYADQTVRFLDEMASMPPRWRDPFTISDWRLRLTQAEAMELNEAIFALAERYRRDDPDIEHPDGAEKVTLQVHLLPFPAAPEEEER